MTEMLCVFAGYAERTWTRSFSLSLVNFSKLLRLAKLLRLHHFRQMWRYINRIFSSRTRALELGKLLMLLAFVSHLFSCAWYWVGCLQQGGWVVRHLKVSDQWLERYMAAFYFMASTMTTVGYGDIAALTIVEKVPQPLPPPRLRDQELREDDGRGLSSGSQTVPSERGRGRCHRAHIQTARRPRSCSVSGRASSGLSSSARSSARSRAS